MNRNMWITRFSFAAMLVLAALQIGCFSPYLRRAAEPASPPLEALTGGFVVVFEDSGGEKSALDAAVMIAQNASLESFGKSATEQLKPELAKRGFALTFDENRSAQLDMIRLGSDGAVAALTGIWRHPQSSMTRPMNVEGLLVKPADVLAKLSPKSGEHFAFVEVSIRDQGLIWVEPGVVLRTVVYDAQGQKVLDLQGVGQGKGSLFFTDRSADNLREGLTRAVASLESVEPEMLAPSP